MFQIRCLSLNSPSLLIVLFTWINILQAQNTSQDILYPVNLIFSGNWHIGQISLQNHDVIILNNDTGYVRTLDYIFSEKTIYWIQNGDSMNSLNLSATAEQRRTDVVTLRLDIDVDIMAIDWMYNHFYFIDYRNDKMVVTNRDFGNMLTLFNEDMFSVTAISLDPVEGWMFWSNNGCIERLYLDGKHRQIIASSDVELPNSLTLDLVNKRVFWADSTLNDISSCDYDGQNRKLFINLGDFSANSITVLEDWIYWSDDQYIIYKTQINKSNISQSTIRIHMNDEYPNILHVYHPHRQPLGKNYCSVVKNPCSQLCFPNLPSEFNKNLYSCMCFDNYELQSDDKTCKKIASIFHPSNALIIKITIASYAVIIFLVIILIYRRRLCRKTMYKI